MSRSRDVPQTQWPTPWLGKSTNPTWRQATRREAASHFFWVQCHTQHVQDRYGTGVAGQPGKEGKQTPQQVGQGRQKE